MNGSFPRPPSIDVLKGQARRLRASLNADGVPIESSKSLELLAHQYGYKNWNTLRAVAGNGLPTCPVSLGAKVKGQYLGRAFKGEVIGVQTLTSPDRFRVTLHFDQPIDVVIFGGFSNFRKRVTCTIDSLGKTFEKTSNGYPHMQLDV